MESLRNSLHNGHNIADIMHKKSLDKDVDMDLGSHGGVDGSHNGGQHIDLAMLHHHHHRRHQSHSPPHPHRCDSQDSSLSSHYSSRLDSSPPPPLKINDNAIDLYASRAPQYHHRAPTSPGGGSISKMSNGRASPLEHRDFPSSNGPKYLSSSSSPPPTSVGRHNGGSPFEGYGRVNGESGGGRMEDRRSISPPVTPPVTPTDLTTKHARSSESGSSGLEDRREEDLKMEDQDGIDDRELDRRSNQSDWTFEEQFKQVRLKMDKFKICINCLGKYE